MVLIKPGLILFLLLISSPCFAQFKTIDHKDSAMVSKIHFQISSNKAKYKFGEEIRIQYSFMNISTTNQKIYIQNMHGYPRDMHALIKNEAGIIISNHVLQDIITPVYIPREEKYFKLLEPGKRFVGEFSLLNTVYLKKEFNDSKNPYQMSHGTYEINLRYNLLNSNKIKITIQ